jgi:hypothetical protein
MSDANFATARPAWPEKRAALKGETASRGRARDERNFLREELARIGALAEVGLSTEARGACADFLFDFQPMIVAHSDLVALCEDTLLRCGATALWRRFRVAAHGDAGADASVSFATWRQEPRRIIDRSGRRMPEPIALWAEYGS